MKQILITLTSSERKHEENVGGMLPRYDFTADFRDTREICMGGETQGNMESDIPTHPSVGDIARYSVEGVGSLTFPMCRSHNVVSHFDKIRD